MSLRRRDVLVLAGSTLTASAGCLSTSDTLPPPTESTTDDTDEIDRGVTDDPGTSDDPDTDPRKNDDALRYDVYHGRLVPHQPHFVTETEDSLVRDVQVIDSDLERTCRELDEVVETDAMVCDADALDWAEARQSPDTLLVQVTLISPTHEYDTVEIDAITAPSEHHLHLRTTLVDPAGDPTAVEPPVGEVPTASVVVHLAGPAVARLEEITAEASLTAIETPDWFDTDEALIDADAIGGWVEPADEPPTMPDPDFCDGTTTGDPPDEDAIHLGAVTNDDGHTQWVMRLTDADGSAESGGPTFERGEEFRIRLTNVSTESVTLGPKTNALLDVLTTDGWHIHTSGCCIDGPAFPHGTGGGHEWAVTLTADDVAEEFGVETEPRFGENIDFGTTCPDLPAGRYRFRYPVHGEYVAVIFDLVG